MDREPNGGFGQVVWHVKQPRFARQSPRHDVRIAGALGPLLNSFRRGRLPEGGPLTMVDSVVLSVRTALSCRVPGLSRHRLPCGLWGVEGTEHDRSSALALGLCSSLSCASTLPCPEPDGGAPTPPPGLQPIPVHQGPLRPITLAPARRCPVLALGPILRQSIPLVGRTPQ